MIIFTLTLLFEMSPLYIVFNPLLFQLVYCYENGNGVLKLIKKSSKNKNNGFVYMINA